MTTFFKKLEQILNNKKIGSSELVNQLNELFKIYADDRKVIEQSLFKIKNEIGHFTVISKYISELDPIISNRDKLKKYLSDYTKHETVKYEKLFNRLYTNLTNAKTIITLSRSGTLLNVLRLWHQNNKKLKVVVCESRPKYEGRIFAQDLLKFGYKVEVITDLMMHLVVPKIDAAFIGADSVLKNGNVINKIGSRTLALLCKEYKKPFYVVTTRSKFSNKSIFKLKSENPAEVWNKQNKNLKVSNTYFEEIEKKLITKIISD